MPCIDVHAHAFPDKIAARAVDSLARASNLPLPGLDGTLSGLLASMSEAGIDCSWLASIATRPEQAGPILEWAVSIRSKQIMPLGSVHPDSPFWLDEVAAIADAGLFGIKLHPQYQGFAADEARLLPLYREIARRGLFVLMHAGYDPAFPENECAAPARIARVHRAVPELPLIAAHLGGFQAWDEVIAHLVGSTIYFDTSFMHEASAEQRAHIFRHHDSSRILFGSDSPWTSQSESRRMVQALPLARAHQEQILGGNAQRLLQSLKPERNVPLFARTA